MATIQELTQELIDHVTLAQQGLARSEFADGAVIQPVELVYSPTNEPGLKRDTFVLPEQVMEFCVLVQASLSTILATAQRAGV